MDRNVFLVAVLSHRTDCSGEGTVSCWRTGFSFIADNAKRSCKQRTSGSTVAWTSPLFQPSPYTSFRSWPVLQTRFMECSRRGTWSTAAFQHCSFSVCLQMTIYQAEKFVARFSPSVQLRQDYCHVLRKHTRARALFPKRSLLLCRDA